MSTSVRHRLLPTLLCRTSPATVSRPPALPLHRLSSPSITSPTHPLFRRPSSSPRFPTSISRTSISSFHTSSPKMVVHELTSKDQFKEAIAANPMVVVDCTATWCGPCKMISPVFDKLSDSPEGEGVYFAKFDVDEVPELAAELGVRAMPTFKAYKNGEAFEEMLGANPPALTALIEKVKA